MKLPAITQAMKDALATHEARQAQAIEIQDGTFVYLTQAIYCIDCAVYCYEDEIEYLIDVYKCKEAPECYNMSNVSSQAEHMRHEDYKLMQSFVYTDSKEAQEALNELIAQNSLFVE